MLFQDLAELVKSNPRDDEWYITSLLLDLIQEYTSSVDLYKNFVPIYVLLAISALSIAVAITQRKLGYLVVMAVLLINSVQTNRLVTPSGIIIIGMLISMPGVDPATGQPRLTWDWYLLNGGLKLLPVLIGIFAVSQIISDRLIDGQFDDWREIEPEYRDTIGDIQHRDHRGYGDLVYTNTTGRNDLVICKAAYDADEVVTLTPEVAAGWEFNGWSGDAGGSQNPLVVAMDGAKTITATFTEASTTEYTLVTSTVGNAHPTALF